VDEGVAGWAVPAKAVHLRFAFGVCATGKLYDKAKGACGALRTVGDKAREEKEVAFFDDDIARWCAIERADADGDIAFELIEDFFGWVDVEIVASVRAAGDKDDGVFAVGEKLLIADRRL